MVKQTPLQPEDWIQAAFRALTKGGAGALRVEPIARSLKVSKGSFYWHFKDLKALQAAMLQHWVAVGTQAIVDDSAAANGSARAALQKLLDLMTDDRHEPYGGISAESAIREWARLDRRVAQVTRAVDQKRLAHLGGLLQDLGLKPAAARSGANLIYGALIGLEHLEHQGLAHKRKELRVLLDHLVSQVDG